MFVKCVGLVMTGALIAAGGAIVGVAYGNPQTAPQVVQVPGPSTVVVVPTAPAQQAVSTAQQVAATADTPAVQAPAKPAPPTTLSDMVAWYQDPEKVKASNETPFGSWATGTYAKANSEKIPEVKAVKVEKADRLSDAFTKKALDQDKLHIQSYTALVRMASTSAELAETVQRERLADEREIEALENPSFWTTVKWWWNR